MAKFVYQERSQEAIARRATQKGTNDWPGFTLDDFPTYRARDGENWIRILPKTWEGAPDHYGIEVWLHSRIGADKATILCLRKMRNQRCPVCEEQQQLDRDGDTEGAKALRPYVSTLAWIIDMHEQDKGPQLWAMPYTKIDQEIQIQALDRQTGHYYVVDDPFQGYDIYFQKTGKQMQTQYSGVSLAKRPTSVNPDVLEMIADFPVQSTLLWRDYDEVKALFDGGIGPEPQSAPQMRPAPMQGPRPPSGAPQRQAPPPQAPMRPTGPAPVRAAPQQGYQPPQQQVPMRPAPQQQPVYQQPQQAPQRAPMRRPLNAPQQGYQPPQNNQQPNATYVPPPQQYPAPSPEGHYPPPDYGAANGENAYDPAYDPNLPAEPYNDSPPFDTDQQQQYAAPQPTNSAADRFSTLRQKFNNNRQ